MRSFSFIEVGSRACKAGFGCRFTTAELRVGVGGGGRVGAVRPDTMDAALKPPDDADEPVPEDDIREAVLVMLIELGQVGSCIRFGYASWYS
jgi:hypothetical protein